jgi:hypothetical protein
MTEPKRHNVPLEPALHPGSRSGEGSGSVLRALQQQVQAKPPPDLVPDSEEKPAAD